MRKKKSVQKNLAPVSDWIEIYPYAVTMGVDQARPVMIFKEKNGESVMPVWMSNIDVGIAISQNNNRASGNSPHDVTAKIMQSLSVALEKCVFAEVRGHHQYVDLYFRDNKLMPLRFRADQAISFCLHEEVPFYCQRSFIAQCKDLNLEMGEVQDFLASHNQSQLKKHPYLM